ncbi:TPA: toprim domain-containing protein [Legionella pneumophila]|nr:toprim domain-containing protein [Legionella pneumophila]HBP6855644.1 toprim domain-containing protein [Legionella pneumophila]HBP6883579.1 toprim domain-containing protein [Legionella pneumophila]HBP6885265.1 toprim domain-containing protein [Legionella pneumophila]HBP6889868.1 toprim domain-containing protein [Legionella pneumophila]
MSKFSLDLSEVISEVIGMGKATTPEINQLNKYIIDKKSIKLAKNLWARSVPLKGTPAERYIVGTRKIPAGVAEQLQIRSLKGPIGIPEFDKNKPYEDYVVAPVYNLDDELVGLQIIQIDPNGKKATNPKNSDFFCKRYLGSTSPLREGKAAVINKTDNVDVVFIAEGVETAASVASLDEVRKNHSVLASMGVSQLPSTLAYVKTHYPPGATVVLLQDYDDPVANPLANLEFEKACIAFAFAGYKVIVKKPKTPNDDWNGVLVRGGVELLTSELNLDNPVLIASDIPARNSKVTPYFKTLYADLLKNEKLAEEQVVCGLLDKVIGQLIDKLKKTQSSDDLHTTIKEIDEVIRTTEGVRTLLSENKISETKNIPRQLKGLRRALEELKLLEERRRDSLRDNDYIDSSTDPQTNTNGDLYKAYYFVMSRCLEHLGSLGPHGIFDLEKQSQILGLYQKRLKAIDNEIKRIPQLISEFGSDDEIVIKQLKNKLKSLKLERKLYAQEFHEMKQQMRLLRNAHLKDNTPYANFYELFVEEANSIMIKGKTQAKAIREELTGVWANRKKELQESYKKRIEATRQHFVSERKKAMPPMIEYLEELRAIVKKRSEEIDGKSQEKDNTASASESRNYQERYLRAMEELGQFEGMDKLLQDWLNNLENFKTVSPLIYYPPQKGETVEGVELIDYDSDGEETLDNLRKKIFDDEVSLLVSPINDREKGKEKLEGKAGDSDPQVMSGPSHLAEGLMQSIQSSSLKTSDSQLYLTIKDFSERLAVGLYKSFEVISPESGERQEFDGLALRKKGLTIIERKTNDGTGPGLFQRNFCQQKIVSKHDFVLKNIIAELQTQSHPEKFIDIDVPEPLGWYSENFTPEMQERLVNAAKSTVIKALQNLTFEFNVNRPTAYSATDYRGLFFNRGLIPGGVSLRFSSLGKGNEEVAHQHMDKISKERTAERESRVFSMRGQ